MKCGIQTMPKAANKAPHETRAMCGEDFVTGEATLKSGT